VTEFKKALDGKTYAADVDADVKLGESVAVEGTPTCSSTARASPTRQLRDRLGADRQRAQGHARAAAGTPG